MALGDVLADIYQHLGASPPEGAGLQYVLADIYARLGLVPPSGMALQYVIEDIYRHLEARAATKGKR